jgi:hypothetical protein
MARIRALTRTSPPVHDRPSPVREAVITGQSYRPPIRESTPTIPVFQTYQSQFPDLNQEKSNDDSDFSEPPPRSNPPPRVTSESVTLPDALRLQQENVRLKAELLKTQKQLQAVQEENRNLMSALEKNEQLRVRYKQQLAALQQTRQ